MMSLTSRSLLALVIAAFVLIPAADAQIENPTDPTPTTLYFHIFDTFNKFVINTQPMNVEYFEVGGTNFPTLVNTPVNDAQGAQYDFNTIYGTSTAGPVEYNFIENGKPRFHPEPGIARAIDIDENTPITAYIYIDIRDAQGTNEMPDAVPNLHFRVTMRTGDQPGDESELDNGELIMQGESVATVCANADEDYFLVPTSQIPFEDACTQAAAGAGENVLAPDDAGIVEYAIPMTPASPVSSCASDGVQGVCIPKEEAFNIRIDWWQEDPNQAVCGEDQCAEGFLRLAADQDHLPRMEMAIENPVYIEFIHPQVAAGTLLIHTGVNSPWGTYDIDAANITMAVDGPSEPEFLQQVIAQNQHVHGLHDKAAEITYLWKFRDEGAKNGDYTIHMEVPNVAGTATAIGNAGFTIEGKKAYGVDTEGEIVEPQGDDSNDSPGLGLVAVLGALGVAGIALRRRRL